MNLRTNKKILNNLDGHITQEFYDQKSMEWRIEQDKILEKIEKHQNANRSYLDEGIKLLELHLVGWSTPTCISPTL